MDCRIDELKSISDIEAMRTHWTRLQWHPNSDIDVYQLTLKSTVGLVRPYALVVRTDGEPRAILAGRIEDIKLNVKVGYLTVPGPKTRKLTFIHGGLLGEPSRSECEMLLSTLLATLKKGDANMVFFNHLRTDSLLYEAVMRCPGFQCRDYCLSAQTHRRTTLEPSAAEYKKRLSAKIKNGMRWRSNKLLKCFQGRVRIECYSRPTELEKMVRDVESVAALTYQRGLGAGFGNSPDELARLQMKANRGWLRTYVLYVVEKPVAFWSGTVYREAFHSEFMGYDPAYRQFSPGTYLIMRVIEGLCDEKGERAIGTIDWGLGDAEYKKMLADREWQDASPCIYAPNLRGIALNAYRTPLVQADNLGHKLLGSDLQARLKRLWRDRRAAGPQTAGAS